MNKKFISVIAVGSILFFGGCGSNNKSDGDVPVADQSLSLSLLQTSYGAVTNNGTYIVRYAVHAVDQSGNPHSKLPLKVSVVNAADRKCYYHGKTGTINTTEPYTFSDYNVNFSQKGTKAGDALIILPTSERHESAYLGDWKVTKVGVNLELGGEPAYNLETMDQLEYVVGGENCFDAGKLTNVHTQKPDDSNASTKTSDIDKGLTYFDVVYDQELANELICLGVHVSGMRAGTGECFTLPSISDSNSSK